MPVFRKAEAIDVSRKARCRIVFKAWMNSILLELAQQVDIA
jgi:hypothetical protein